MFRSFSYQRRWVHLTAKVINLREEGEKLSLNLMVKTYLKDMMKHPPTQSACKKMY